MLKILFATDGSDHAKSARDFLAALPLPEGSGLHVVSAVSERPLGFSVGPAEGIALGDIAESLRQSELRRAAAVVEQDAAALAREGVTVTRAIRSGEPAHQILAAADEFDADLVVVGSPEQTGLAGFLLGSVANNVARHASRPVLVARAPRHGLRHVVVAVDESEHATHAAYFTARLPLPEATEFTVIHVLRPYHPYAGYPPEDTAWLEQAVAEVRKARQEAAARWVEAGRCHVEPSGHRVAAAVREGNPAEEIRRLAEACEADLIVAGARGVSFIEGLLLGSVADRLLKTAPCSVLLVR